MKKILIKLIIFSVILNIFCLMPVLARELKKNTIIVPLSSASGKFGGNDVNMVKLDMPIDNNVSGNILKSGVSSSHKLNENNLWGKSWKLIKGQPIDDSILLGMYSYHTRKDRDQMNESNNLAAIDFKGYSLGTFNNSYHVQTYYVGIGRKVYEYELPYGVNMDLKYRLVAFHGYSRYEPDIAGITPTVIPMLGFSKGHLGVDFLISPGKTVTFATNLRINFKQK